MLKEVFSPDFLPASVMIPLFLIIGIAGLYYGAELLVKGASELALHFKVKPVIIGLTVVAFGTSAPELMVSLIAAFQGEADVSVGNIVGSNIANIGLIIGLTAMLIPITRTSEPSRFEFWCLAGISLLLIGLSVGGMLGRLEGAVLFSLLIVFLAWCYKNGSMDPSDEVPDEVSRPLWAQYGSFGPGPTDPPGGRPVHGNRRHQLCPTDRDQRAGHRTPGVHQAS